MDFLLESLKWISNETGLGYALFIVAALFIAWYNKKGWDKDKDQHRADILGLAAEHRQDMKTMIDDYKQVAENNTKALTQVVTIVDRCGHNRPTGG